MKYLIAGLGNIGSEYDSTRHNIGFDVADIFTIRNKGTFTADKLAEVSKFKFKSRNIVVIKPTTYMNLSGKAVKYWMDKEKISLDNVLIIIDELALPLGTLRMKGTGSDGGHNGLKSIQEILQTKNYPRLRFGIGNNFPKGRQVDFVLGKWTRDEMDIIKDKVIDAAEMVESFIFQGIERTMNNYNK